MDLGAVDNRLMRYGTPSTRRVAARFQMPLIEPFGRHVCTRSAGESTVGESIHQ
jgi:hypothetical protein